MSVKSFLILLGFVLVMVSCKTSSKIITSKSEAQKSGIYKNDSFTKSNSKHLSEGLIRKGLTFLGTPYRAGGTTKTGMDCSGLIQVTFNEFDIALPRTSAAMASSGKPIKKSEAQKGDLIFFKTNGKNSINHVGLIVEIVENEIKFLHSSTSKGVMISSTKEPYFSQSFAQINRIIN